MFIVVSFPWPVPSANVELSGPWLPRQEAAPLAQVACCLQEADAAAGV